MSVRLAIRGFAGRFRQFEELLDLDEAALETLLPGLAEKHAAALAAHNLHMIEIEFLDEPDIQRRFFRFGTDPAGMVLPLRIDLRKGIG